MSLTLRSLPTLLTDCVLVGHARKADVVFTPRQWFAIGLHMLNENPANFFLMPYRDKNRTELRESVPRGRRETDAMGMGYNHWKSKVTCINWVLSYQRRAKNTLGRDRLRRT